MSEPLIDVRGLHYGYPGSDPLLRDLNLAVWPGERVALTGANGSGKSTLLHVVLGLLPRTGGELRVGGRRMETEDDFAAARRRLGLLFQDPDDQLFCTTVEEDLAFGPFNLGLPRAEVAARVDRTLERLAIPHLRARVTYRLSEGEKRLVSLGTLLTMEPEGLLLDEPTNGLDEAARARLLDLLGGLAQSMLIVSHDHDFLARLATRHLHLAQGRAEIAPPAGCQTQRRHPVRTEQ